MENMRRRPQVTDKDIDRVLFCLKSKILERLDQKGWSIFVSSHEILGVITEEYDELTDAVRANDPDAIEKEALDIAVAALFGLVSLGTGKMDWPKRKAK